MRVITFPESLNGETGLVCSYLGYPAEFCDLSVSDVLEKARAVKGIIDGINFVTADRIRMIPNTSYRAVTEF